MRLTKKLRALILDRIESGDQIVDIADAIGVTRQALYKAKLIDEDFGKQWAEAAEIGQQIQLSECEKEADFRGRIGYLEPKFFEGRICGHVQKYSDSLLQMRLRALAPEKYGDRTKVDATVKTEPNAEHMANLDHLSIEDQRAILEIVERAAQQHGADGVDP